MQNDFNPANALDPDKLVAGRYRLRQFLGKGSFGQVFYADDTKFEPPRSVALKLLHPQYTADLQVREDLKREASVLARFNHPNILEVLDYGVSDELAFIVTKLADGGSLAQKLRPNPTRPPVRMSFEEIAQYLEQIADGLDEAHRQGLVHRDIKPQNILLDRRGRPLIADFGLAAAVSSSSSSALIDAGTSGTALYMAPEQWQGRAGRASDIYALGVMLYQMLTGHPPFMGSQLELMGQHLSTPAPSLSYRAPDLKYPPTLDELIYAVLAKDPRSRPRPAKELSQRFKAAIEAPLTTALLPGAALPPTQKARAPISEPTRPLPLLPAELPTARPAGTVSTSAPVPTRTSPKRKRFPVSLIVGVEAIALVIIAAVVFFVLTANNSNGRSTTVSQSQTSPAAVSTSTVLPSLSPTLAFSPTATNPAPTTVAPTVAVTSTIPSTISTTPVVADLQSAAQPTTSEPLVLSVPTSTPLPPTLIATRPAPTATPIPPTPVPVGDPKVAVQAPVILAGHSDRVISVAFSPDGKTLASGSFDTLVKLWNVETGKELKTLRGHTAGVRSVTFSADGKTLASSGNDSVIKIWDVNSGNQLLTLRGHTAEVGAVAFSPDGTLLVSGSDDHNLKIWEVASGKELKTLSGHSREVNSVVFSPDGKTIASGSFDNTIKLWDVEQGKELKTLIGHKDQVFSVVFSPDGKMLASASVDRSVRLWEWESGKELKVLSGHTDEVPAVVFSPDGKIVASGGGNADNSVRLWEVATGKALKVLPGHSSGIRGLAFSPDGTTLASASRDTTIRLWRISIE